MSTGNVSAQEVGMPTYLQDIYRCRTMINLVHNKLHKTNSAEGGYTDMPPEPDSSIVDCELIGNPLVVDLGEPLEFPSTDETVWANWTNDEACYGPISYEDAKTYLSNGKKVKLTHYCLLNGDNPRSILCNFQGCEDDNLFYRGAVTHFGYFAMSDEEVKFSVLLDHHYRFCEPDSEVQCAVHTLYPIFGVNKRHSEDVADRNVEKSAFIEVFSTEKQYLHMNNDCRLFLQINAADPASVLHPLWQQLTLLKKLIDYLDDNDDLKSIVISTNPKPFLLVTDEITVLLRSFMTKQYDEKVAINWSALDVNNMRNYNFLEKLYTTLLQLEDLSQILESFHSFFNDLIDEPINEIPGLNNSTLAVIINGLICGNLAVPTLTLASSLQFMIELGLHKLHNDYLCLINSMDAMAEPRFTEQWTKISEANTQITATSRKSRVSIAKGNQNTGQLITQLNHLTSMHLITELMHLAIKCNLVREETLRHTFHQLYESKAVAKTFKTLQPSAVVDFDCKLLADQYGIIKSICPVSVNVKFFSHIRDETTVTTIFHFSSAPIFPPCIFKNCEVEPEELNKRKYYVHKSHIFVN